jgi:N-acetylglutamate synthase-like GNAT family acetyltransferase
MKTPSRPAIPRDLGASAQAAQETGGIVYRAMTDRDLDPADAVHRAAFARFFGADPKNFRPESRVIHTRYATDPRCGLVADAGGIILGCAIIMDWGRLAVVGPIAVRPDRWGHGIAGELLTHASRLIARRGFRHAALFTHPQSGGHVRLYQSHGFWPGTLIAVMSRPIPEYPDDVAAEPLCAMGVRARKAALDGCRRIAEAVYRGLDLTREIEGLRRQQIGDTLVLRERGRVRGFAVCHCGDGSEARANSLYVKFAAVRPGDAAGFARLVAACEALAHERGADRVTAGVSTARRAAYRALLDRGYRADLYGVAMHAPDAPAYDRPDRFVLDDLR